MLRRPPSLRSPARREALPVALALVVALGLVAGGASSSACTTFSEETPVGGDGGGGTDGAVDDAASADGSVDDDGGPATCERGPAPGGGCLPFDIATGLHPGDAPFAALAIDLGQKDVFVADYTSVAGGRVGGIWRIAMPGPGAQSAAEHIYGAHGVNSMGTSQSSVFFNAYESNVLRLVAIDKTAKVGGPSTLKTTAIGAERIAVAADYVVANAADLSPVGACNTLGPFVACAPGSQSHDPIFHLAAGGDDFCYVTKSSTAGFELSCGTLTGAPTGVAIGAVSRVTGIDSEVRSLAVRGDNAFWSTATAIGSVAITSGKRASDAPIADASLLALDDKFLFMVVGGKRIVRCDKTNCAATKEQLGVSEDFISAMTVGDRHVYFAHGSDLTTQVARVPR